MVTVTPMEDGGVLIATKKVDETQETHYVRLTRSEVVNLVLDLFPFAAGYAPPSRILLPASTLGTQSAKPNHVPEPHEPKAEPVCQMSYGADDMCGEPRSALVHTGLVPHSHAFMATEPKAKPEGWDD